MQCVGVFVPSELLVAGEEVQVYGPDANGDVDLSAGIGGGRVRPVRLRDGEHHVPGQAYNGPSDLGTMCEETRGAWVFTEELPTGLHEFAARAIDRETGEGAGDPTETVKMYLNTSPRPALLVQPVEELVGGKLRFNFGELEE